MKVAMVKHKPYGKVFWFEIPEHLVGKLQPGFRVACNTARGRRYGTVVAADLDEQDVKEVMLASGATFPLSTIEATTQKVLMSAIKIPEYMARTKPSDEKIAKRFLEFYVNQLEVTKMKTHTLKFKGDHGRPEKIAEIRDLNEAGQPKSDQDILNEAFLLIHAFCAEHNFEIYYTRIWNHNGVTIFDVGSHIEFFHLTPAVSLCADTVSSERSEQNG